MPRIHLFWNKYIKLKLQVENISIYMLGTSVYSHDQLG